MKLTMSREWFEREVQLEEGLDVSVGLNAPAARDVDDRAEPAVSEGIGSCADLAVFGKLVNLRRRERGMTLEALAEKAAVGLDEVCAIDSGRWERAKSQTVHNLAAALALPDAKLMQLSGLVTERDYSLQDAAVHFAARAQVLEALTPGEAQALDEFVRYLSEA